jgi:multiple sugar transport system substrate-binding protein
MPTEATGWSTNSAVIRFGLSLLAGIFLLSGCRNKAATSSSQEPAKSAEQLVVAINAGDEGHAVAALAAKYPNAKIEIVELAYSTLREKLNLTLSSSRPVYDVVLLDDPWFSEIQDKLSTLPALPNELKKDIIPACLALGTTPEGAIKALPFVGNTQLLFYRKDLLAQLGVDAPPTKWSEILKLGQSPAPASFSVYCIRGKSGAPLVSDFLPVLWSAGGELFSDPPVYRTPAIKSAAGVKAFQMYAALMRMSPPGSLNYDWTEMTASFIQGKSALELNWPAAVPNVDKEIPTLPDGSRKWGVVLPPAGDRRSTSMIGNWLLAVPASSQKQGAAFNFILWLMDHQHEAAVLGNPPTRKSVFEALYKSDPKRYFYYPVLEQALENSTSRPRTPRWSQIEDALSLQLTRYLSGQTTVEAALDELNSALPGQAK